MRAGSSLLRRWFGVVLLLAGASSPSAAQSASPAAYRAIEIPAPPGTVDAVASDINVQLTAVGLAREAATGHSRVFIWDPQNGSRVVPGIDDPTAILINDLGILAGIRRTVSPSGSIVHVAFLFANGVEFARLPIADAPFVEALRFTNSGILLLHPGGTSSSSLAMYQSQIYDLTRLGGQIVDVAEDGTLVGQENRLFRFALVRRPDGSFDFPFEGFVSAIGPLGHIAGRPTGSPFALYVAPPGGAVATIPTPVPVTPNSINRFGATVGVIFRDLALGHSAFVYRESRLLDLNEIAAIPGRWIVDALSIDDDGAILVSTDSRGRVLANGSSLLLPAVPVPPATLSASVNGRTVTLSWQSSPGAISYVVEAGSAPTLANLYSAVVGSTTGLTTVAPPGTYFVRIRAQNASGVSAPSNEIVVFIP